MKEFIPVPAQYVGYALNLYEARMRIVKGSFAGKEWQYINQNQVQDRYRKATSYFWFKLYSSDLHAFALSKTNSVWHRIPTLYWLGNVRSVEEALLNPGFAEFDEILSNKQNISVPEDLLGQPIMVWQADADAMLANWEEENEAALLSLKAVLRKNGHSEASLAGLPLADNPEQHSAPKNNPSPSSAREAECRRVAAELDRQGVTVRSVKAHMIEDLWDNRVGKRPNVGAITGLMAGGGEGGRPPKIHKNRQFT